MTSTARGSGRRYDASGRQAAADERRRRVVDAAHRLFLEQGYGETSIGQIAEAARVSAPTVYAAFESKAGILARVVDVAVAGDYAAVDSGDQPLARDRYADESSLADPDLPTRLAAMAHFARLAHERSAPVLRLAESVAGADPAIARLVDSLVAALREDIDLSVSALPADRLRPELDHEVAGAIVFLLLGWRTFDSLTRERGWSPEEYERHVAATLVHALLPDSAD
jgi:AcrR family transcriptional regulator